MNIPKPWSRNHSRRAGLLRLPVSVSAGASMAKTMRRTADFMAVRVSVSPFAWADCWDETHLEQGRYAKKIRRGRRTPAEEARRQFAEISAVPSSELGEPQEQSNVCRGTALASSPERRAEKRPARTPAVPLLFGDSDWYERDESSENRRTWRRTAESH